MKILVTAFVPFDGRLENASSLALRGLKGLHPEIRTRILPVDSVIAPARLRQALRLIRPDALIMLGEAAGSKEIRLETTAWNELDFRIADNGGRMPRGKAIIKGAPSQLSSTLPLETFREPLEKNGHPVRFSDDPGRYLCNQVFYTARHDLDANRMTCPAGFIHLPLARDYPTERSVAALDLMVSEMTGRSL
ncbi:pyroglutamyl-peptidase I [Luteolibacter yonseiensis]|uniref:Pyrrolidone-carboxylate peptidase n=1 Tax=Luteolibacter yonseiensis TaxID=1144680 RepID=A0A934VAU9_9BACT|nr:pyroglutamyl-peptidase I [Luteolibacter yonseiensis]MBK1816578.1 pyroglutamyl-peptidase I [Luteolibacter yonseiensis]